MATDALFSYGTLLEERVQRIVFGRRIRGAPDVLPGFTVDYFESHDPRVFAISRRTVHPAIRRTGNNLDKVTGQRLDVADDELEAADEYEIDGYVRVRVRLRSGVDAWVYVSG